MMADFKSTLNKLNLLFNRLTTVLLGNTHHHYTWSLPRKTGIFTAFILGTLFSRITINNEQADRLKALDDEGIVIFTNKYKSNFEFLFYHFRYRGLKLPFPQFGFYYRLIFWQPVRRMLQILLSNLLQWGRHFSVPSPFQSGYVEASILDGQAGFLSLIDKKGFYRRFIKAKTDPIRFLIEMQASVDKPIYIVPQIMFYGTAPQKSEPTLTEVLFGPEESPGRIRRLYTLIRHPKKIFVDTAEPVNLQTFLSREDMQGKTLYQQAFTLRSHLLATINSHRRSIIGPVIKSRVELKETILTDTGLQQFIRAHAKEEELPVHQVQKKAEEYIEEIAANYSANWIKAYDVTLRVVLKMMFDGMVIDMEGLNRAKKMATRGPLILVPCHKSHLDYLILSWIFLHNHMPCPHIAAGKNLSFWPMGTIFRGGGAFFLRRTFKGNVLYGKMFNQYIAKILQEGFNLEFFIEGTRSRTGKLLMPKLGLLSIIVNAILKGVCEDAIFVPIFIGYDRVIEEKAYIQEVEGGKKEPESLKGIINARKKLKKRYGKVYVNFDEPLSFRDYLARHNIDSQELSGDRKKRLFQDLGFRFINGINNASVVTPYGLVAAAILNCPKKRASRELIQSHFTTYMIHLSALDAKLSETLTTDHQRAFESVLSSFINRKFIEEAPSDNRVVSGSGSVLNIIDNRRPGLDYYKNNCIIFFVPAAFTALAILEMDTLRFAASDLHPTYRFLQKLFINEFAYDVDKKPDFFVRKTLKAFIDNKMLAPHPTLPDTYSLTATGIRKLKLFAAFLTTFLESYLVVLNFFLRYPPGSVKGKNRLKKMQTIGNRMYKRKEVERAESFSKISFLNADKYFVGQGLDSEQEKEKVEFFLEKIQTYINLLQ
jgi:glycerol-3-phosphate O-acyltransferase